MRKISSAKEKNYELCLKRTGEEDMLWKRQKDLGGGRNEWERGSEPVGENIILRVWKTTQLQSKSADQGHSKSTTELGTIDRNNTSRLLDRGKESAPVCSRAHLTHPRCHDFGQGSSPPRDPLSSSGQ